MGSTIVVTGASRFLGRAVAAQLAAMPEVEQVIGVDTVLPTTPLIGASFVRCDLIGPAFGRILAQTRADTVVHLSLSEDATAARDSRLSQREANVVGSLRLLAAVQAQHRVRKVVLKSTGSVYGSSPGDPAFFTEDSSARPNGITSSVRDAIEVENYVRSVSERRPEISTCILRLTHIVGPHMHTPFMRYLSAPLVPVPLGFDARIQVLQEDDAIAALALAACSPVCGTINVAADGAVPLSAVVRRARRIPVPMAPLSSRLWALIPGAGSPRIGSEAQHYLYWGRVLDTTRMREELGFRPVYTSADAMLTVHPADPESPESMANDVLASLRRHWSPR